MTKRRKPQLPTEPVTLEIENLSHDGRGVAHREGKTLFIDGALTGEAVSFLYTCRKRKFDEGKTVVVHQASAERVEPPCAHAAICGGCSLQHLASDAQIALKQQVLLEQLKHFGGMQPQVLLPALHGPVLGYRHKARLGVKFVPKKGGALVGFREKRSPFLAEIERCPVLVPAVGERIMAFKQLVNGLDGKGNVPQFEIAHGDEATAWVVRHLEPLSEADIARLVAFSCEHNLHLYLQPGGYSTVHRVWPEQGDERLSYELPDFGLRLRFHPLDFTQVNPIINRQMINQAIALLKPVPTDRVLDLFCGLGNFTLPLATLAGSVVGVEGEESLVARGRENATHNKLTNLTFHGADLTKPFATQAWAQGGFDKILIDPPRTGALEIVQKITAFKPERLVYVSCNPATLARDAGELGKQGYRLAAAGVMDMFPHTTHVESIALFIPK